MRKSKPTLFGATTQNLWQSIRCLLKISKEIDERLIISYEYNNILRKCTIKNDYWKSSWEYEMIDEIK